MIEYQRVELPVKKQSVLEWLERETHQWVQSNGLVQYHVPTNDALYSIQAQRPSVDWRAGIVRVAQMYTIETNDDRPMQIYGFDHGGLDLLTFEVIELPNGLVRITARCNDFDRTGKAGQWFFNVLDNLWAEMLRVCTPLDARPSAFQSAAVSGGVDLNAENLEVGGDLVGRDKIESAGGNIFHVGPGATAIINESNLPPEPQLLIVAKQIRDRANAALNENQEILSPVILDPTTRYAVARNLSQLFQRQQSRGDFGEWLAFLETARPRENNPEIRATIEELLVAANELHRAFYAYYEIDDEVSTTTKKRFISDVLYGGEGSEWWRRLSDQEVIALVEGYLNFLRTETENIGRAVGKLNVLLS